MSSRVRRRPRRSTRRAPSTGPSRFFGLTALSVETSTKRSAPNSTATSASDPRRERVVAHRLERVRLHQRHVLVGGRVEDDRRAGSARRPGCIFVRSLAVGEHRDATPRSRARRRARARSRTAPSRAWSTRISRCGPTRAIWRQSSEPIEPPAPVTSTVSSLEVRGDSSRGRPRPARGRARPRPAPGGSAPARLRSPEISSYRPGSVFTGTRSSRATSTIRWRASPEADGIAISTSSGRLSRRMCGELVRRAEHADAVDAQVLLARVVVDRGRSACSRAARLRCISRITSWPASPAPTIEHLLAARDERPAPGARSACARAGARRRRTRAGAASRCTAIERGSRTCATGRDEVDGQARRRAHATVTPRAARPHVARSRRSATSGCRSRRATKTASLIATTMQDRRARSSVS